MIYTIHVNPQGTVEIERHPDWPLHENVEDTLRVAFNSYFQLIRYVAEEVIYYTTSDNDPYIYLFNNYWRDAVVYNTVDYEFYAMYDTIIKYRLRFDGGQPTDEEVSEYIRDLFDPNDKRVCALLERRGTTFEFKPSFFDIVVPNNPEEAVDYVKDIYKRITTLFLSKFVEVCRRQKLTCPEAKSVYKEACNLVSIAQYRLKYNFRLPSFVERDVNVKMSFVVNVSYEEGDPDGEVMEKARDIIAKVFSLGEESDFTPWNEFVVNNQHIGEFSIDLEV